MEIKLTKKQKVLTFVILFFICVSACNKENETIAPTKESIKKEENISPISACLFLNSYGFRTGKYTQNYDENYFCITPPIFIGDLSTITYSASGTLDKVNEFTLTLNYYYKDDEQIAKEIFVKSSKLLTEKTVKINLPDIILEKILTSNETKIDNKKYILELKKLSFENKKGYSLSYIIKLN